MKQGDIFWISLGPPRGKEMDYPKITEQDICEIEREDGF